MRNMTGWWVSKGGTVMCLRLTRWSFCPLCIVQTAGGGGGGGEYPCSLLAWRVPIHIKNIFTVACGINWARHIHRLESVGMLVLHAKNEMKARGGSHSPIQRYPLPENTDHSSGSFWWSGSCWFLPIQSKHGALLRAVCNLPVGLEVVKRDWLAEKLKTNTTVVTCQLVWRS